MGLSVWPRRHWFFFVGHMKKGSNVCLFSQELMRSSSGHDLGTIFRSDVSSEHLRYLFSQIIIFYTPLYVVLPPHFLR